MTGSDPDPRVIFANERTFLAWHRTGLALVATGLAVDQFLDVGSNGTRLALALPLILLGAGLSSASYRRWRINERRLRLGSPPVAGRLPVCVAVSFVLIALFAAAVSAVEGVA